MPVEQFLASLRIEQSEKLDQLGIEIGSKDSNRIILVRVQALRLMAIYKLPEERG